MEGKFNEDRKKYEKIPNRKDRIENWESRELVQQAESWPCMQLNYVIYLASPMVPQPQRGVIPEYRAWSNCWAFLGVPPTPHAKQPKPKRIEGSTKIYEGLSSTVKGYKIKSVS